VLDPAAIAVAILPAAQFISWHLLETPPGDYVPAIQSTQPSMELVAPASVDF